MIDLITHIVSTFGCIIPTLAILKYPNCIYMYIKRVMVIKSAEICMTNLDEYVGYF